MRSVPFYGLGWAGGQGKQINGVKGLDEERYVPNDMGADTCFKAPKTTYRTFPVLIHLLGSDGSGGHRFC